MPRQILRLLSFSWVGTLLHKAFIGGGRPAFTPVGYTNLLNSGYTSEVIRLVFASFICSKVKANWY